MEAVLSNGLLVSTILKHLRVPGLIKCAQVNPLWEEIAVKLLNRKAIISLDFDDKPMSKYVTMVQGEEIDENGDQTGGGRCHDQISLDGRGSRNPRDIFYDSKLSVTREQFDSLVAAVQEFGPRVKTLLVKLEFGEGKPAPEEYQTIFSSAINVEFLRLEFQFPGLLESMATLPPQIGFPHLKKLIFCTNSTRPLAGLEWTEEGLQPLLGKIVTAAPNLVDCSGPDQAIGIMLEEIAKSGGQRLEEKIEAIGTCPAARTTNVLMQNGLENLKILQLTIQGGNFDNFVKIVEKYKNTLQQLHLFFAYRELGGLRFPSSMDKLEELHVHFDCPYGEDESAKRYPAIEFPSNETGENFYPKLAKVVMGGTRQTNWVMPKYLAIIFPGQYWRSRLPRPEFTFPSVRHLDLENYDVKESDLATFRRIVNYFPNLHYDRKTVGDMAPESGESEEDTNSEEEFYYDSDSDY